jgi:UPF0755 protein
VKFLLRLVFSLTCVLGLLAAAFWLWLDRPLALPAANLEVRVLPGSGVRGVARALNQAGVPLQAELLILAARLAGREGTLRAGTYGLAAGITPRALLAMLAEGRVLQVEVRLIEGWTFAQWRARLDATEGLEHASAGLSEDELMRRIGFPGVAAEGMFFPDTYRVDKYARDLDLLRRAATAMQTHLAREWAGRAPDLPYRTPYEALIMASLIEKETGDPAERPQIAGVFVNRLRRGMRLQTDPAVIYGLGARFDGRLHKADLLADTPYNTYTRTGLPPTPIAMPGLAALQAALHPARTPMLYFVARGDGRSHFSPNLDEHNAAVARYQRAGR